jgi:4-hydroxy-tetrahydrodipicolinate synthase
MMGHDGLFAKARAEGADGVVSGVACAVPELMVGLERAITSGNATQSKRLESRLDEFITWIDRFPAPVGVIAADGARGLKVGPLAIPLGADLGRQLDEFRDWFRAWLPEVQRESGAELPDA